MSKLPIASKLGDIEELLKATPELNNTHADSWQGTLNALKQEGFSPQNFSLMISQNPRLLITNPEKISNSINSWRMLQFGEKQTLQFLEKNSEFIHLEISREVFRRFQVIKEFIGGGSNMLKLLTICPSVLLQNASTLKDKIDYLQNVMKVEPVEVYKSEALSQNLDDIKTRHVFLQRLGLYVVKKNKDPNEISKNPKLHQITDTSDRRFASKVCFVTPEEFEVFQEMYKTELEAGNSKELDEEEFSDSDDEDSEIKNS